MMMYTMSKHHKVRDGKKIIRKRPKTIFCCYYSRLCENIPTATVVEEHAVLSVLCCVLLERLQMAKGKQQDRTEIVNVHTR